MTPTPSRAKSKRPKPTLIFCRDSIKGLESRPEARNLLGIYAALADVSMEAAVATFAGQQFSVLKDQLSDVAVAHLAPMQDEYRRLLADKGHVDSVLSKGVERARTLAARVFARSPRTSWGFCMRNQVANCCYRRRINGTACIKTDFRPH